MVDFFNFGDLIEYFCIKYLIYLVVSGVLKKFYVLLNGDFFRFLSDYRGNFIKEEIGDVLEFKDEIMIWFSCCESFEVN